ncbi:serine/threonine-protein phosphatase pp2a-related [Anaeramoeba flamelloides]|uniref:Serine/threonine-protein phosphatase n=1 Tax=Anaeramoeba flamelloides TaxID=1746091 RepID=A0AAV7ZYR6_9EUKA|nr:serine/threonine-protein phosphatase pp2a-related [Anaeramoeba flamelloides]KAJ6242891.1 serine/threonine-protein phosphatase pp2a-related [Anaeramoeba flamelloides]
MSNNTKKKKKNNSKNKTTSSRERNKTKTKTKSKQTKNNKPKKNNSNKNKSQTKTSTNNKTKNKNNRPKKVNLQKNMHYALDQQIEEILNYNILLENEIYQLCEKAKEIFLKEGNVVNITAPIIIVGDTHGQYPDLLHIFSKHGSVPDKKYLFLGDYVDRGSFSVETITLLIATKVRYPDRITLLRGNHESQQTTKVYGFYQECLDRYGNISVWRIFTDMFEYLPIAGIINNSILAIHGGLSPDIEKVKDIRTLDRFKDIPFFGPLCDLMWSDPDERDGFNQSFRGAGYTFGENISKSFLKNNKLSLIVRAHQLIQEGFNLNHSEQVVTIFSAPNYCGTVNNLGSIMKIENQAEPEIIQFEETRDHPKKMLKVIW